MKNPKMNKNRSTLFYIVSVLLYTGAFISIVWENSTYLSVILLALGSTFLCLGSLYLKKDKEKNSGDKNDAGDKQE